MRSLLVRGLREEGYEAQGYATGTELLRKTAEVVPDLFVIDIGLPDTDGRVVCQALWVKV
jgi:two-component system response regulator MprA